MVADGLSVRALESEVSRLLERYERRPEGRFDYELEALMLTGVVVHTSEGRLGLSEAARQLIVLSQA